MLHAPSKLQCAAPESDEIDIELVGGDPKHWQTNVFAPAAHEDQPLYGTLSSVENYPLNTKSVNAMHYYSIDWSPERIVWSVDGVEVRTLEKGALPTFPWTWCTV